MDFKAEFNSFLTESQSALTDRCTTCLSFGRKVSPLGKYAGVYTTLAGPFYSFHTLPIMAICWECRAALQNIITFQHKVQKAAVYLTQGYSNSKSLSRLTTTLITDCSQIHHSDSESDNDADFKTDLPTEQYSLPRAESYLFEPAPEHIKVEPEAIKAEEISLKKEQETESSEKQKSGGKKTGKREKPKAQSTRDAEVKKTKCKFKFVSSKKYASKKDIYNQVRIKPAELKECLEKERNCTYYTRREYKCKKCITGFVAKEALLKHRKTKHAKELGRLICDVCKGRFRTKNSLVVHMRSHFYKYECKHCAYVCYRMRNMLCHYRALHSRVAECLLCGLHFVNRNAFYQHYRELHDKYICDYCGARYRMRYSLVNHIRRHHTRRTVHCDQCSKTFKSDKGYWQHKTIQHPAQQLDKAYCVECDKYFKHRYAYIGHINSKHKPKKPTKKSRHQCPSCEKTFSKNIYMKNHYDFVHLKDYKNRCDPCGRKFLRPAELIRHNRQTHEGIPPPKNKLCYICGRGFTNNKILANHIRVHTGERPFACVRCPARFTQRTALVTHTKNVHREKYIPPSE